MALYVLRRLLWGAVIVVLTAFFAYGGWRYLRNDLPENHPWLQTTVADLKGFFLHGDFGNACSYLTGSKSRPCPKISLLFRRGWQADLWLIAGAIGFGAAVGMAAGLWSAVHPRSVRTRLLDALAMLGLCAPPFVFGYGLLLLFEPSFGALHLPFLFSVHVYAAPYDDPLDFLRGMFGPWLVAGAPVFAIVMRITRSTVIEATQEDFMRTAIAKGLTWRQAVFRHGRPLAYPAIFSWLGTASALLVLNVLITESVFSVPGFLYHTRRAFRPPANPERADFEVLQAEAVWGAVLIVVLVVVSDLIVMAKDPRVRARGRPG